MTSAILPELSVVVIILGGDAHLVRCLQALRRQRPAPAFEIIVPYDDAHPEAGVLREQFPDVVFLPVPGARSYAELRSTGLRAARGAVVAVTEDQCIPPERWCANIAEAHRTPHAAIGGPVEKQEPDRWLNWAIYLRELGTYMPPVSEGPSQSLTDCNVSYKRSALEAIASVWTEAFHEPQVHGALRERGETLWLAPTLLTYQQRSMSLGAAVRERYEFGRLYGSLRVAGVPPGKRLVMLLASPLLPALLLARVVAGVLRKRRHIGACLAALPYLALFSMVWSWGELVGYLLGRAPTSRPAERFAKQPSR